MVIYEVNMHKQGYLPEEPARYGFAEVGPYYASGFFFDLDNHLITWTREKEEAETIIINKDPECSKSEFQNYLKNFNKLKTIIHLGHLFHVDDVINFNYVYNKFYNEFLEGSGYEYKLVHQNWKQKDQYIYFDYSFNLVHFAFRGSELEIAKRDYNHLYNRNDEMYRLPESYNLDSDESKHKIFLSPNAVHDGNYHSRMIVRMCLTKILENRSAYYADTLNNENLLPQTQNTHQGNLMLQEQRGYWFPVHNWYYRNSIISLIIESIVREGPSMSVTEKVWIPVVKGHFLLPFGPRHFVKFLKEEYNLKFPDWIDYSYDTQEDFQHRISGYLEEVNRLSKINISKFRELYKRDIHILKHNRDTFLKSPRTSGLQLLLDDASRS